VLRGDGKAVIRTLLVDDHEIFRMGTARLLAQTDDIVVVGEAQDGEEACVAVDHLRPDLVLMDLVMPRVDGSAATRRILESHPEVKIVVLSSYVERVDVLDALESGAVGYLRKDARPEELYAGIRTAVNDPAPLTATAVNELVQDWRSRESDSNVSSFDEGRLVIDRARHEVRVDGEARTLTLTEYELLTALAGRPGRVYSRLELTYHSRGHAFEGYERTVDVHIKNLRRKIEASSTSPRFIETVRGVGYRLGVSVILLETLTWIDVLPLMG
jgi:DNA-binding response OmpR family regulator